MPRLSNADPDGPSGGHGEAAQRCAWRGEDRGPRVREILQFVERRTESALQFAAVALPSGGVRLTTSSNSSCSIGRSVDCAPSGGKKPADRPVERATNLRSEERRVGKECSAWRTQ